jgi:hypothetical protein
LSYNRKKLGIIIEILKRNIILKFSYRKISKDEMFGFFLLRPKLQISEEIFEQ